MATTGVRLTLKFDLSQGLKYAGWSESYDLNFSTIASATNDTNMGLIEAFIAARLNCLGEGVVCVSATLIADAGGVIVPPRPRRATVQLVVPSPIDSTPGQTVYNPALGQFPADFSTTVLYFSLTTDQGVVPVYRRNMWIAGIPDASSDTSQIQPLAGVWRTAFAAFLSQLFPQIQKTKLQTTSIIAIRSVDQSGANPVFPCTSYAGVLNQYTVPAHPFATGQLIEAIGFRAKAGQSVPRGQYKCVKVDANTISLSGANVATASIPPGGFRPVRYVWNPCKLAVQEGFSKRNKGRPFELLVGRRPTPRTFRS